MATRIPSLALGLWLGLVSLPAWADAVPNSPAVPDPTASTDMQPTGQSKPIQHPQPGQRHIPAADRDFLVQSARNDVLQIRLGRVAAQQAGNPALKRFASRIVTDHTSFMRQRDELVAQSDADLPKDLDQNQAAEVDRLGKLDQQALDRPYLDAEVASEKQALATAQNEVAHGSDPDVVAWAKGTLHILQGNIDAAARLEKTAQRS